MICSSFADKLTHHCSQLISSASSKVRPAVQSTSSKLSTRLEDLRVPPLNRLEKLKGNGAALQIVFR
jgi:plasmid maintenance system killer protein